MLVCPRWHSKKWVARTGHEGRDYPHTAMKETVGHCRIEQSHDHTTMNNVVISLQATVRLECSFDDAVIYCLEVELQRQRIPFAAQQTPTVTILHTDVCVIISGHRRSHPLVVFRTKNPSPASPASRRARPPLPG